jgi:hypothetical protein
MDGIEGAHGRRVVRFADDDRLFYRAGDIGIALRLTDMRVADLNE